MLNSLIIFGMFCAVLISASSFVYVSVTDDRASLKVLSTYVKDWSVRQSALTLDIPRSGTYVLTASSTNYVTLIDCIAEVERLLISYDQSLILYLMENGSDYSVDARRQLALAYGITEYKGTDTQDELILGSMLLTEVIASPGNISCRNGEGMFNSSITTY